MTLKHLLHETLTHMTKTEELLNAISGRVSSLAIAGYIKEEVITSLKYLHWYKLKNIDKNIDSFCEYLEYLNSQNTEKINSLVEKNHDKTSYSEKDLSYFFMPEKKLSKAKEKIYVKKLSDNGYELITLIQGVKWILVLSIDEFCNASKTRMDIHQLLMKDQINEKKRASKKTCKKK